jgi:putative transposase
LAVAHLTAEHQFTERRACGLVGISRAVLHYASRREDDAPARSRLKVLAGQYRRYGYLRLHVFLRKARSRGQCQANLSPVL